MRYLVLLVLGFYCFAVWAFFGVIDMAVHGNYEVALRYGKLLIAYLAVAGCLHFVFYKKMQQHLVSDPKADT